MSWTPPWTPGLPQARCRSCVPMKTNPDRGLVVAMTLVDGECAQCRARPPRPVVEPEVAAPAALFDLEPVGPGF